MENISNNNTSISSNSTPLLQTGSIKTINWTKVLIGVIGIGLLMGGSFYVGHKWPVNISSNQGKLEDNNTKSTSAAVNLYKGWLTYTNKTYGYSFKYPSNWTLDITNADPTGKEVNGCGKINEESDLNINSPSKDGFVFGYNINCGGSGANPPIKTKKITVDNMPFVEAYVNSCTEIRFGCTNSDINNKNEINEVVFSPVSSSGSLGYDSEFQIGGKTVSMYFLFYNPNSPTYDGFVDPNSSEFISEDAVLDNIVSSFTFPQ